MERRNQPHKSNVQRQDGGSGKFAEKDEMQISVSSADRQELKIVQGDGEMPYCGATYAMQEAENGDAICRLDCL
jgi:hypothetical protein